jgi:hypothetical protein
MATEKASLAATIATARGTPPGNSRTGALPADVVRVCLFFRLVDWICRMVMFMGFDSVGESWRPGATGAREPKCLQLRDIGIITAGIFKTALLSPD